MQGVIFLSIEGHNKYKQRTWIRLKEKNTKEQKNTDVLSIFSRACKKEERKC